METPCPVRPESVKSTRSGVIRSGQESAQLCGIQGETGSATRLLRPTKRRRRARSPTVGREATGTPPPPLPTPRTSSASGEQQGQRLDGVFLEHPGEALMASASRAATRTQERRHPFGQALGGWRFPFTSRSVLFRPCASVFVRVRPCWRGASTATKPSYLISPRSSRNSLPQTAWTQRILFGCLRTLGRPQRQQSRLADSLEDRPG